MTNLAVITLTTGERLDLGPVSVPWHGLFTALGILAAAIFALRYARERELDEERLIGLFLVVVIAGMAGARAFFLLEDDPSALLRPGDWFGTNGFSFYGAVLASVPAGLIYLRRTAARLSYFDAAASGFGLGMAIGRIGDLLIGEHLGDPSDLPWAVRYTNPEALAPSTDLAYQPGPFYESLLGLAIFALIWPQRRRFQRTGLLMASVVGLYAAGRFVLFFLRNDSDELLFGLSNAQVTSLLLALVAVVAALRIRRDT